MKYANPINIDRQHLILIFIRSQNKMLVHIYHKIINQKEESYMKNIVLIDTENVNLSLEELLRLDADCQIIFFISKYSKNISMVAIKYLVESKIDMSFEYIDIEKATKNCLDFHIVAYLGMYAKEKCRYYIYSNDKGFQMVSAYIAAITLNDERL